MLESFKASPNDELEKLYVLLDAANGFVDQAKDSRDKSEEVYNASMDFQA